MRVLYAIIAGGLAATLAACDATGPTTGAIRIAVATAGVDLDIDGYNVRVDNGSATPAALNGTLIIAGLPTGTRVVRLQGLAPNCQRADNFATHSVTVVAGDTVDTAFDVSCSADVGVVRVFVSTSGGDPDPDGYIVSLDGAPGQPISDASLFIEGVRTGVHTLTLSGVAENCHLLSSNAVNVTVAFGGTIGTEFIVNCVAAPGKLRVTTPTAGVNLDPDGYEVVVDDLEEPSHIAVNGELTFDLTPGNRSVELTGVAPNCTVSGPNPRVVSVVGKTTSEVVFSVSCAAPASAEVRVVTTGVAPDPNGYTLDVAGNGFHFSIGLTSTGSATVTGMGAGNHSVTLSDIAMNCEVSGSNPRTVAMVSGATAEVTFDVTCGAVTKLALSRRVGADYEIHVVNSNGTGLTRLTTSIAGDFEPSWSPDGSKIAFRSERDGNAEIYVMNATGTNPVRLTNTAAADIDPTWSPDGSKIAFVSERDSRPQIYVMDADGTNLVRLTNNLSSDVEPSWSPDGTKIAFRRETQNTSDIYTMNANGTGVTRVTSNAWDMQPDWSPDGSKIAFTRQGGCGWYYYCVNNIFVMNADGSGIAQLESVMDESHPTWSPDGRWIAVVSYACDYYSCSPGTLVAVKSDAKSRVQILNVEVVHPSWRR